LELLGQQSLVFNTQMTERKMKDQVKTSRKPPVARRTGMLVFDALDVLNPGRTRRNLLMVDRFIIDDANFELAVSHADLLSTLYSKTGSAASAIRQFQKDFEKIEAMGALEHLSYRRIDLLPDTKREVDRIELSAQEAISAQRTRLETEDGRVVWSDPALNHAFGMAQAALMRSRSYAADRSSEREHLFAIGSTLTGRLSEASNAEPRDRVLRVVLHNMPVPDPSVSIEEVVSFREETQPSLSNLRRWMIELSESDHRPEDIQTIIEEARQEYERGCGALKIKGAKGIIQFIITKAGDLVGDVLHGRFGNIARTGFEVFDQTEVLLEKERSLPGREIAYLDKAWTRFPEPDPSASGIDLRDRQLSTP
jgi:hypothetical protein